MLSLCPLSLADDDGDPSEMGIVHHQARMGMRKLSSKERLLSELKSIESASAEARSRSPKMLLASENGDSGGHEGDEAFWESSLPFLVYLLCFLILLALSTSHLMCRCVASMDDGWVQSMIHNAGRRIPHPHYRSMMHWRFISN